MLWACAGIGEPTTNEKQMIAAMQRVNICTYRDGI